MTSTTCTPTVHGYAGEAGRLACEPSGGLPITGLDLILMAAVALGLIVLGLLLRRVRRRPV